MISPARDGKTLLRLFQIADEKQASLGVLLILSGFFGLVFGFTSATWQGPLETSQVLLGWVKYPEGSPYYAYHASIMSIVSYAGALLLKITNSEAVSSVILAIIVGILSLQSLAMLLFLVIRNAYISTAAALVVMRIHLFGFGIAYPIIFMGSAHTMGRIGLTVVILSILCFGFSKWRAAFFLAAFSLAVHPGWGLWLNGCIAIVLLIRFREFKQLFNRPNFFAYGIGLIFFIAVLVGTRLQFPVTVRPNPGAENTAHQIFLNHVQYWDYHRQAFRHTGNLAREIFHAILALAFAAYFWVSARGRAGLRFFAGIVIVSAILGIVFVFVPSWFRPSVFPPLLIKLMPGRFINIAIFLGFPLLLAHVMKGRRTVESMVWFGVAWGSLMFLSRYLALPMALNPRETSLLLVAGIAVLLPDNFKLVSHTAGYSRLNRFVIPFLTVLIVWSAGFVAQQRWLIASGFSHPMIPPDVRGSVLTTAERYMLQLNVRRPSLTPLLDAYSYTPDASALLSANQMMRDIYGISLADPPPPTAELHRGLISTKDFADSWARRSCSDWERLSQAYDFGYIVVPGSLKLQLKKMNPETDWNGYYPRCES